MKKLTLKQKLFSSLKIIGILWLISSIAAMFFAVDTDFVAGGNVAVIPIYGVITTTQESGFSSGMITSDSIIESLDKADTNPAIKAILLDINSPGGSGVAADEVGQKIKSLNKTTVSVIRDVGASAAYWIASATDYIFANKLSFTGSIGATGSYLEFSRFLEQYNISYQRFVSGELKDMGSAFKEPSANERRIYQKIIDDAKDIFVEEVALNRNLSIEEVNEMATGQVYLGREALELKLIDELGTKQDALLYIEANLNITAKTVEFKQKKSFSDLLSDFKSSLTPKIGKFINPTPLNNFQI